MDSPAIKQLARECGFELAGIAPAGPLPEAALYASWIEADMAGEMRYLTGRRAEARRDPRNLLPTARSIVCVGKLYNTPGPASARVSRYAWGEDYHRVVRAGLAKLAAAIPGRFDSKICVDTAPLLERALARRAGLGWIGKNTCLIRERAGSWFFLGELLLSLDLEPDTPVPERCGSCTRCIDACPTGALTPHRLDARLCLSYLTIELCGSVPVELRPALGGLIFGCDICQQACPWNRHAPITTDAAFQPRHSTPALGELAALDEAGFQEKFRDSAVPWARLTGILRNVATAMGNSGRLEYRAALERLAQFPHAAVMEHARWALERLSGGGGAGSRTPAPLP